MVRKNERPYKGIRMRKWGKWVAEIREPNKRSRIWLGSYSSPIAAARAYDVAVYYLRGPTARLNFPEFLSGEVVGDMTSAADIRKKAIEVGSSVDAVENSCNSSSRGNELQDLDKPCSWFHGIMPDLNEKPEPEDPGNDDHW